MGNAAIYIALFIVIIVVFITVSNKAPLAASTNVVGNVTVEKACEMIRADHSSGKFIILDVRTPREFEAGYIPGAVNINVTAQDFAQKVGKLPRNAEILVYCRSGNRSLGAIKIMKELGFTKTYNMLGGFREWGKTDCARGQ